MDVTFNSLVTPAGVVIAAGIITGLIQLLKTSFTVLDARVSGATLAFVISFALYIVVGAALNSQTPLTPDAALGVFLAWLSAATSSVGIRATFVHARTSGGTPVNDAIEGG